MAVCSAYPSQRVAFAKLAEAPVIATCIVQETSQDSSPASPGRGIVAAHATLLVLRSFPELAIPVGQRIHLDYEALPALDAAGYQWMSGPDVPPLTPNALFVLPLKLNRKPSSEAWRLIADEGRGLVIPAILRKPAFAHHPRNGREFLLQEIASTLISGTRSEVFAETSYGAEKAIASDLMYSLKAKLGPDDDRWALIAASLLSSAGVPRPTIAEFRAGKDAAGGDYLAGSFITTVLQRLGDSAKAKERLIHHLLLNSDIASWGAAMTLREFAQEASLTRELRTMLQSRRPGALLVAWDILGAGQKEIRGDATALALHYIFTPGAKPSDVHWGCFVIRDFGTDEQFGRLIGAIKESQYQDPRRYNELWSDTIRSDNKRERAVLEILLQDQRIFQADRRYSDIARSELARIEAHK
jgi:hypothetical protein